MKLFSPPKKKNQSILTIIFTYAARSSSTLLAHELYVRLVYWVVIEAKIYGGFLQFYTCFGNNGWWVRGANWAGSSLNVLLLLKIFAYRVASKKKKNSWIKWILRRFCKWEEWRWISQWNYLYIFFPWPTKPARHHETRRSEMTTVWQSNWVYSVFISSVVKVHCKLIW